MSRAEPTGDVRRERLATALLGLALTLAAVTVGAGVVSELTWAGLVDLLVVTNLAIGLALAVAGWPIARHRPRNPIGWSLLVGGCCYLLSSAGVTVIACAAHAGWGGTGWRVLATVVNGIGWNWAVGTFIPLALLLFPDGRLPGRRWRWLVVELVVCGAILGALGVLDPLGGMPAEVGIPGYPASTGLEIGWLQALAGLSLMTGYLASLAALATRYRRGGDEVRAQVLWMLLAMIAIVAAFTIDGLRGGESALLGILPLLLIPLAIVIAVLRHQLLDIRVAVSRSLVYLLLTGGVVAAYLALVAVLDRTVRERVPFSSAVAATLLIALAFNPARVWLQGQVHRALYGARRDPVRAIVEVGARLGELRADAPHETGFGGVLEGLCRVMRLPAAVVLVEGAELASYGRLPAARHAVALNSGGEQVGELVVGLRSGERRLAADDERVLALLASPLAVAVQAVHLADQLRTSREHVILGREEERRRMQRDLHDGLGPVLTGVALSADAALRLLETDRARSAELIGAVRDHTMEAIEEVRRLAYDLRPPVLDSVGLVGALHEAAAVLSRTDGDAPLAVTIDAPHLPELPAAVEVAAYRIVTEALTNVVRHSTASTVVVRARVAGGLLQLEVNDDGVNANAGWKPGVGLTSIRERAAELGGESEIGLDRTGGRIRVSLPVPVTASSQPRSERPAASVGGGAG